MTTVLIGRSTCFEIVSNSAWRFVSLWLKRENRDDALFYWNQAAEFQRASSGLPEESAPLLRYYTFLNAAKALLTAKGVDFVEHHGIRRAADGDTGGEISLAGVRVQIADRGVLPALSTYLRETEQQQTHSLKDLLLNLAYIHRTYCLTFPSQSDLFLPLVNCRYLFDPTNGIAFLNTGVSRNYSLSEIEPYLPPGFASMSLSTPDEAIRSTTTVHISSPDELTEEDLAELVTLNNSVRAHLHFISGIQTLWYLKIRPPDSTIIDRSSMTVTLAAMHQLSEMCRYRPLHLSQLLAGQDNWLLSEFIRQSRDQFIDEIASEITGHQILAPNVRPEN